VVQILAKILDKYYLSDGKLPCGGTDERTNKRNGRSITEYGSGDK